MSINNTQNSNQQISNILNKWDLLYSSIKANYLLVVCIIVQIVGLSILYPSNPYMGIIGNIICGFITFTISIVAGYYVHVYSHLYDYRELYNSLYNAPNVVGYLLHKLPKSIQWIIDKLLFFIDFHDKIHHDTTINKQWQNIIIETLMNIYTEGVGLIIFFKLFDFGVQFGGYALKFNYPILFAWCLLYATIHNINYNIVTPVCHIQHHIDQTTNYGIDFMDIVAGSKYDNSPEEMNHASLNVILIMLFIIFIKDFCSTQSNINTNSNSNSNSMKILLKYLCNFLSWFITN